MQIRIWIFLKEGFLKQMDRNERGMVRKTVNKKLNS